ncbi:hypothetical protein OROHE_023853 [Orobanche hederae]
MTPDNIAPDPGHDGIFRRYISVHQRPPWIYEITPAKETWKLHVRVERLWTTYSPYNPTEKRSMELILLDAKIGETIECTF